MSTLVFFILTAIPTLLHFAQRDIRIDEPGTCFGCRYDMAGLAPDACCPECGLVPRPRYARQLTPRIRFMPRPLLWVLLMIPLLITYLLLADFLAEWLVAGSYRAAGYSWTISRKAAHARELRLHDPAEVLWTITIVICISPLLGWIKPIRRAWMILAAALILAAGTLITIWILPYLG